MGIHHLRPAPGAKTAPKRVGRGPGSGMGKTSTRGHKGQGQRSGYSMYVGFEGGQMPLHRRLPKRGFRNPLKRTFAIVNLDQLDRHFEAGATVNPTSLLEKGLIRAARDVVKVLGRGTLTKPLTVQAHRFSRSAVEKIQQAGGRVEVWSA
ncbi:MAG: 50S ribosomal protein L15 [Acidobacteria bacterium]|nr:50S ribosomal protein L15 [Acidobacteriota bacterium]MDW7984838.1 50S ribosomal protein L15 [Acidobacteriota bacterium]